MKMLLYLILVTTLIFPQRMSMVSSVHTWQDEIDGYPVWVTIVSGEEKSGLTLDNWREWGNTTTDTYIFSINRPEDTRLIISFRPVKKGGIEANIFLNNLGRDRLDYKIEDGVVTVLSNGGYPYFRFNGQNASWNVAGKPDYNIGIVIDGPFPGREKTPFPTVITDGRDDWRITLGADSKGVLKWQRIEVMNDPRPYLNYQRFALDQRGNNAPEYVIGNSLIPGFPYFDILGATNQDFKGFYYSLVDAEIKFRKYTGSQSGIYSVNSSAFPPYVDFESPFVWYNFDPAIDSPQLVARGWYYPANAPLVGRIKGYIPAISTFRYSWKLDTEDNWRFSLQVAGPYAYDQQVTIGSQKFLGIPENQLLEWITAKQWPVTTFVESVNGFDGEGIYFYSPQILEVLNWFYGQTSHFPTFYKQPFLQETDELLNYYALPAGFRGEYRIDHEQTLQLYYSPVDQSLHLKNSQGGFWYLGNGELLRYENKNKDSVIDTWVREVFTIPGDVVESYELPETIVKQQLFQVGRDLIFSDGEVVRIIAADLPENSFELEPPVDLASWQNFQRAIQTAPIKKDPADLSVWVEDFQHDLVRIDGASLSDFRLLENGFRLILDLHPDHVISGEQEEVFSDLRPGKYLVQFTDFLTIQELTPLDIQANLSVGQETVSFVADNVPLQISLQNTSLEDAIDLVVKVEAQLQGESVLVASQSLDLLSDESHQLQIGWQPMKAGLWSINLNIYAQNGILIRAAHTSVNIQGNNAGTPLSVFMASGGEPLFLVVLILGVLVAVTTFLYYSKRDDSENIL